MSKLVKDKLVVNPKQSTRLKQMMGVLTGISDKVRIDWDGDKAHLYSMLSVGNDIQGFCSYYVDSADVWSGAPRQGSFIFYTGKKYVEGTRHWEHDSDQLWTLERRDDREYYHHLSVQVSDLRVPFVSAYSTDVRHVPHDKIMARLESELSFDLYLSAEQMTRVTKLLKAKRLQQTTNDREDTIRVTVDGSSIVMASGWELSFDSDQTLQPGDYYFQSKYLTLMKGNVEDNDYCLKIHDTYVSVQLQPDSYYMFPLDIV